MIEISDATRLRGAFQLVNAGEKGNAIIGEEIGRGGSWLDGLNS